MKVTVMRHRDGCYGPVQIETDWMKLLQPGDFFIGHWSGHHHRLYRVVSIDRFVRVQSFVESKGEWTKGITLYYDDDFVLVPDDEASKKIDLVRKRLGKR
jgi:hypothetical protein